MQKFLLTAATFCTILLATVIPHSLPFPEEKPEPATSQGMGSYMELGEDGGQFSKAFRNTLPAPELYSITWNKRKKPVLAWKKVPRADGYEIARSTEKNGEYQTIKRLASKKALRYTDHKAFAGKRYYYKVRAVKRSRNGFRVGKYSRAMANGAAQKTECKITKYGDPSRL